MAKYKKWSSEAKFKISLEVIKGDKTLNEICQRYEVTPSQVSAWKKQLLEDGQEVFNKKSEKSIERLKSEAQSKEKRLFEKIGQLTVERDFLKKSWEKFQESDDGGS